MHVPEPQVIAREELDARIAEVPEGDAVFVVWAGGRSSYLAKTSMLRRRLMRIFKPPAEPDAAPKRSLNLRSVATRVEYWPTASRFESMLVHYALARCYFPDEYLRLVKLRMPRTQVSSRLSASRALHYGPFQSRAAAELFQDQFLDLFQIRRCQENLEPSPSHPGCIYGEMGRCLRPCQQVVSRDEYASEASRVEEFLRANGTALLSATTAARDRLSTEENFEEAARQHKRLERIQAVLALAGDLAADIDRLYGIAIAPSLASDSVSLWFLYRGAWQAPIEFPLTSLVSLDQRLRELVAAVQPVMPPLAERQEHLALLARWHYATWSDGEWIGFPALDQVPYRKLVRAISRVSQKAALQPSS